MLALEENLTQELAVQEMAGGGLGVDSGSGPNRARGGAELGFLRARDLVVVMGPGLASVLFKEKGCSLKWTTPAGVAHKN
ncbi:hypothetical protein PR003_g17196 [Phytophthora rubi]|uniref:Uncharacterized protein n=1 Tax=Phytophthora rubi TaxID=129364 RepID=A0A6A4EQ30_9STRA|nr:hypothetical protein PR002_g17274 [Phytophthora rubi]KAE9322555.1 hypothetical protein PR003_g17196 [Phytophthora rubi]